LLKEEKLGTKLLLIIPVLNLISAYFGQALTRKFSYQPEQTPEMQSQMKMMNIFMPLFSLYIAFQVPTAVGIYWMMSSILSPVQQIALSKMFPIQEISEEEMKEAERLYGGKQKKKKPSVSGEPGKKRRSLVYDDDDEYESVTTAEEKKVLKEKKPQGKTLLDKAPLKDEE
ncbi:MAG: YidC/Oxa1 family membrane protein insertase, partial [Clostridia bacterium]|nr:YidC/Oxa1 family membrane protein insertase [Clostridia bacterium]